eukprot:10910286-Alexandrium_andersonii.AAC.1
MLVSGMPRWSSNPLAQVSPRHKIQPEGAMVPARPTGQTAMSAAWKRSSQTPGLIATQEASHFARRLLRLDPRNR